MSAPDFFSDLGLDEVPSMERAQTPDFFSEIEEQPISSRSMSLKLPRETPDFFEDLEDLSPAIRKQSSRIDPVSAELRSLGYEPDFGEELERAGEFGIAEGLRGLASGSTAGISERVPSLKPEEGIGSDVYRFVGSFLPIGILGKGIGLVANLAKSSPVAPKALSAISKIAGWGVGGAAYGTVEDLARHGELPTAEKIAKDGAIWAGIEAALMGAGKLGSFAKNLIKYAKEKKVPRLEALEEVVDNLKENKINPAENPEEVVSRAEDFLQTPKTVAEVEQPVKPVLSQKIEVKPKKLEVEAIEPSSERVKAEAKEIKSIPAEKRTPEQTQVVALSEQAQPGDPAEKLFENAPLPDKPSVIERAKKAFLKPKTELSKQLNELKQDYYSKKWGLEWDSRHKWDKLLEKKKFSNKELSDMMFYVENPEAFGGKKTEPGTGNPFVSPEDTFEALEKRLSPESKAIVKGVVTPHFKQWVKTINDSGYAKKINPRDFLEGVYIPHFYSGDSKKGAKQAAELLSKRFSTNNPFANMRTFLTYNEALQKAGMKPRFDNIADLLNEYDRVMTRVLVNSEFAGKIADLEKEIGSKLIVRSNSPKKYAEAKSEGWIPFDDPYLRRYVAGTSEEGKPIFATLETPALVHPEAADAFTGIFIKDAEKPRKGGEIDIWKPFDALSDLLKSMHVSLSGFHYLTLAEESAKSSGINLINSFRRGGKLLDDPVFMRDYVQAGGVVGHNPELVKKSAYNTRSIEHALLLAGGPKKLLGDAIKGTRDILQAPSKFLFEEFQPRLKVAAFYDMRSRYLRKLNKKGIVPDEKQMKQINKELASLSNDMFGGQRFELMQNPTKFKPLDFNDPAVLRGWKRAGGYVDWTASAIREFSKTAKGLAELFPGIEKTPTGTAARQNALRYARNLFIATQALNYFTTGLFKDKEGKLSWDSDKAHSTFENDDPSKNALDIALPDIEVDIAGHKFNLGKDEKGRRLYSHFGKKILENFHWGIDPIKQLYNKSNPVWQTLFVQAAGGTPSLEGLFLVESVKAQGRQQPWEAKKGWSTLEPRVRNMVKMAIPYSLGPVTRRGVLPGIMQFLTTGLGTLPVSSGMSLYKAEDFYDKYFHDEKKHEKDILILDKVLKDNGYQDKQIKSLKTRIKNRIAEEKES